MQTPPLRRPRSPIPVPGVRAEVVLGWRLAVRHPVARAALVWSVGLSALARALTGSPAAADAALAVAMAGLLAAVAAPRLLLPGGPREALQWSRVPPTVCALLRVAGAAAFAVTGAVTASVAVAGPGAISAGALAGGAIHAVLVTALAAALAPAWGCTPVTVLLLLLVAAGVPPGPAPAGILVPPGLAVVAVARDAAAPHAALLAGWGALALAGLAQAARVRPRAVPGPA